MMVACCNTSLILPAPHRVYTKNFRLSKCGREGATKQGGFMNKILALLLGSLGKKRKMVSTVFTPFQNGKQVQSHHTCGV
jgi:hypothetical protein